MEWLNVFGLAMVAVIMIPNILFAMKCKDGFVNKWNNKSVETVEQIGRFGCFGFMIINIPGTWFGWWSDEAFAVYLVVDAVLVTLGRPPVSARFWSNSLKELVRVRKVQVVMEGITLGMMTLNSVWLPLAPSISAASSMSPGTA